MSRRIPGLRVVALALMTGLLCASPAFAKASCNEKTVECLARRVDNLEADLRRAIVIFERHHCPEGWIVLEESKVKQLGGTFRNNKLPLVYCKKLDS